jgi:hypothetical protein
VISKILIRRFIFEDTTLKCPAGVSNTIQCTQSYWVLYLSILFHSMYNSVDNETVSWSLTTCFGHKWPSSAIRYENCHPALILVMCSRVSCWCCLKFWFVFYKNIKLHILPVLGVVEVWVFNSLMHFLSVCRGSLAMIFLTPCYSVRVVLVFSCLTTLTRNTATHNENKCSVTVLTADTWRWPFMARNLLCVIKRQSCIVDGIVTFMYMNATYLLTYGAEPFLRRRQSCSY